MFHSSSDSASESKSPRPDCTKDGTANAEQKSDYYYDDATGYEIYKDEDDDDESEEVQNRER